MTILGMDFGYWPVLLLLPILLIVVVAVRRVRGRTIKKAWSGAGGNSPSSYVRMTLPGLCYFLATCVIVFALGDVTRRYVTDVVTYAFNRLYITLDNSSSMYGFSGDGPIYCEDRNLKYSFPRIWGACRINSRIIDATEVHSKKRDDGRRDQLGFLRFARNSFVGTYGTTDYDRARTWLKELNWRDREKMGVHTEIHLALWDMWQVALQRNFRHADGFTSLDERDRAMLLKAFAAEGSDISAVRFQPPRALVPKLESLKSDLRDTAFIIVTDAHEGQFDSRLNASPVSLTKMMKMAEYLEMPVYVISMNIDHAFVRKLAERTGHGPHGGADRGAFYLLKGEKNYEDVDAVVDKILSTRFRTVAKQTTRREGYTPMLGGLAALLVFLGVLAELTVGRSLTRNQEGGVQ